MDILTYTEASALTPGWYAVGIKDINDEINWQAAPLYEYIGDGEWQDECGDSVLWVWDSVLQCNVGINSADAYNWQ